MGEIFSGLGAAKRNPKDKPNDVRGQAIACARACRMAQAQIRDAHATYCRQLGGGKIRWVDEPISEHHAHAYVEPAVPVSVPVIVHMIDPELEEG